MADYPCPVRCPDSSAGGPDLFDDRLPCTTPPDSPTGLPGRCPPVGCPECAYRLATLDPWADLPSETPTLYRSLPGLAPDTPSASLGKALEEIRARLGDLPLDACRDPSGQATAKGATGPVEMARFRQQVGVLSQRDRGGRSSPAHDLAAIPPRWPSRDCPLPLPKPFRPTWPRIVYEFKPSGGLADVPLDVNLFVGGLGFAGPSTARSSRSDDRRADGAVLTGAARHPMRRQWGPEVGATPAPAGHPNRLRARRHAASRVRVAAASPPRRC